MNELTAIEQNDLSQCESIIEKGLQTFYDVGNALAKIRDQRLYRMTHSDFEAYCKERWQMSKTHAQRFISAVNVVNNLTPVGLDYVNQAVPIGTAVLPRNVEQTRPLAPLSPQMQREVWSDVVNSTN